MTARERIAAKERVSYTWILTHAGRLKTKLEPTDE